MRCVQLSTPCRAAAQRGLRSSVHTASDSRAFFGQLFGSVQGVRISPIKYSEASNCLGSSTAVSPSRIPKAFSVTIAPCAHEGGSARLGTRPANGTCRGPGLEIAVQAYKETPYNAWTSSSQCRSGRASRYAIVVSYGTHYR